MCSIFLSQFMMETVEQLKKDGKQQTANSYTSALRHFSAFLKDKDILISDINIEVINSFRDYLVSKEISENSIAYYIRALRAVYNKAVKLRFIKNCHPFEEVSTKVPETKYTVLNAAQLHIIKTFDLSDNASLGFARDMFMLSFYLRGMSYYDMAQLRKSNIRNGAIEYMKKDEEELLRIELEPMIEQIIDRYTLRTIGTDYLLPIVTGTERESINFNSAVRLINLRLKKIARIIKLDVPLTSAVARHSWAMIALQKGLSKKLVGRCLGYKNEYFSQKYFDGLENLIITNANKMVIESL